MISPRRYKSYNFNNVASLVCILPSNELRTNEFRVSLANLNVYNRRRNGSTFGKIVSYAREFSAQDARRKCRRGEAASAQVQYKWSRLLLTEPLQLSLIRRTLLFSSSLSLPLSCSSVYAARVNEFF